MRLSISNRICVFSWNLDIFFSSFNDFMQGQVTLRKRGLTMPKGNLVGSSKTGEPKIQNHFNPQLKCLILWVPGRDRSTYSIVQATFFPGFRAFELMEISRDRKLQVYTCYTRVLVVPTNSDFPGIFPIFSHRSYTSFLNPGPAIFQPAILADPGVQSFGSLV